MDKEGKWLFLDQIVSKWSRIEMDDLQEERMDILVVFEWKFMGLVISESSNDTFAMSFFHLFAHITFPNDYLELYQRSGK